MTPVCEAPMIWRDLTETLAAISGPPSLQEGHCNTGTSLGARLVTGDSPTGTMYVVTQVPMHPCEPRIMVTVSRHLAVLRDRVSLFDSEPTRQSFNIECNITKVEYKYP
jgi:hypothetical protein